MIGWISIVPYIVNNGSYGFQITDVTIKLDP